MQNIIVFPDGYTFVDASGSVGINYKPIYAFQGESLIERATFDFTEIKNKVDQNGGLIRSRMTSQDPFEDYVVTGFKRGAEFYLSKNYMAVAYRDDHYSKIYVDDSGYDVSGDLEGFKISNLMPHNYFATEFFRQMGLCPTNYAILGNAIACTMDVGPISGIDAEYYCLRDAVLEAAYGIKAQTAAIMPVPTSDSAIKACAEILKGSATFSDGSALQMTIDLKEDLSAGVVITETVKSETKRLVNSMRNGFRDVAGNLEEMNFDWVNKAVKPASSGLSREGIPQYLYPTRTAHLDDLHAAEVPVSAIVYEIHDCNFLPLENDIINVLNGGDVCNNAGFLVDAGVNQVLNDAFRIYNAAKANAFIEYTEMLCSVASSVKKDIKSVFHTRMMRAFKTCFTSMPLGTDATQKANLEAIHLSVQPDELAGIKGPKTFEEAVTFTFNPEINLMEPEIREVPSETPTNAEVRKTIAKENVERWCEILGQGLKMRDMTRDEIAIMEQAIGMPGAINFVPMTPEFDYGKTDSAGNPITGSALDVLDKNIETLYGGHFGTIVSQIYNVLRYVRGAKIEFKDNTHTFCKTGLFNIKNEWSYEVVPGGNCDLSATGNRSLLRTINIAYKGGGKFGITLDMVARPVDKECWEGGPKAGDIAKRTLESILSSCAKTVEEGGAGIPITYKIGHEVGDRAGSKEHPAKFWKWAGYTSKPYNSIVNCLRADTYCEAFGKEFVGARAVSLQISWDVNIPTIKERVDVAFSGDNSAAILAKIDSEATKMAAIPMIDYMLKKVDVLRGLFNMKPVVFVDGTYVAPETAKAYYSMAWASGKALTIAIAAIREVQAAGSSDPASAEQINTLEKILKKLESDMVGGASGDSVSLFWLTENDALNPAFVPDIGVLPLFISYAV